MENYMVNSPGLPSRYPNLKEKKLFGEGSLSWNSQDARHCAPVVNEAVPNTPKSCAELRKEIATLETEILHLERYLLSLYRTAVFQENPMPTLAVTKNNLQCKQQAIMMNQSPDVLKQIGQRDGSVHHDQSSPERNDWPTSDHQSFTASLSSISTKDRKTGDSGRRSLGDHLGATCLVNDVNAPDRLSEDILRCISAIYCRLAGSLHGQAAVSASPTSTVSSSTIFSSLNHFDNWSSQSKQDAVMGHKWQVSKEENDPYTLPVEVLSMCLDDEGFNYAAVMLQNFRSLVRNLEKVDPNKMKREEKLAFWINIHNALVMHAYLAYGSRNRIKCASILKAAYNVGGHYINSSTIQSSILGIRSHQSESWLQSLLSPGKKFKSTDTVHAYALEYPEPLVHFALCSGTNSDPVVRVYTAKTIFQELKTAKQEFIQSSVSVNEDGKVLLPRTLWYYGKDMSLDKFGLLKQVFCCLKLTEQQQKAIRNLKRNGKLDKSIHWLPEGSSFRYVIHGELANTRTIL